MGKHGLANVDQLAGALTNNMDTQNLSRVYVENQFEKT